MVATTTGRGGRGCMESASAAGAASAGAGAAAASAMAAAAAQDGVSVAIAGSAISTRVGGAVAAVVADGANEKWDLSLRYGERRAGTMRGASDGPRNRMALGRGGEQTLASLKEISIDCTGARRGDPAEQAPEPYSGSRVGRVTILAVVAPLKSYGRSTTEELQ